VQCVCTLSNKGEAKPTVRERTDASGAPTYRGPRGENPRPAIREERAEAAGAVRPPPKKEYSIAISCNECLAGPAGIAGHPGLWVRSFGGSRMIFRCDGCETLWFRSGNAPDYRWAVVEDRDALAAAAGLRVPKHVASR